MLFIVAYPFVQKGDAHTVGAPSPHRSHSDGRKVNHGRPLAVPTPDAMEGRHPSAGISI